MNHRNRLPTVGHDHFLALLGQAQVVGETVLQLFNANYTQEINPIFLNSILYLPWPLLRDTLNSQSIQ